MKKDVEKLLEEKASDVDKTIEKYIPRIYDEKSLVFRSQPRYKFNLEALNKGIAEPIWEFLDRGGKRWRPALFLLVCEALGGDPKKFLDFSIIPEVIHNGTLIIDDIEDRSDFRRGKPCTYKMFGIDIAINVGNAMYYLPFLPLIINKHKLSSDKVSKIYEIYVEEMIKLSFGQAMDILGHRRISTDHKNIEESYLQMCIYKTGTLARIAAKIAAVLVDASDEQLEKIGGFAETIGVAFQIQDDVLDLVSEEFAQKKGGLGMDITEGKLTLIVVHTLKEAEPADKKRLTTILNMHPTDQKLRDEAINIMKKYDSIEYAKEFARSIVTESWKDVNKLLPPSDAKENLRAFANYLIERST